MTPDDLRAALTDEPLIGAAEVARVLGVGPTRVSRLRARGDLPEPVRIEGSVDAWFRSEIEDVAIMLERAGRVRGRRDRSVPARGSARVLG